MNKYTITLRLDKEVYDGIKDRADIDQRSRNGQINYELGKGRKEYTEIDMIEWAERVISRKGNPPYVLEDLRTQLKRELHQFKTNRS